MPSFVTIVYTEHDIEIELSGIGPQPDPCVPAYGLTSSMLALTVLKRPAYHIVQRIEGLNSFSTPPVLFL